MYDINGNNKMAIPIIKVKELIELIVKYNH